MGYFAKLGCAAQPADTATAPTPREPEPVPAAVQPEPQPASEQQNTETASTVLALEPATDDTTARQAHESAEAKRKAEFDARQAERRARRQAQLDRIKAMNDAELLEASVKRVAAETERLTRRSMKEAVSEHIQTKCRKDAAWAVLAMDPDKSMANCFKYINRKAREYAEQEMKEQGAERTGVYGTDVPDGLVYQWAEDYFNDPDAREDKWPEDKFVPKPYIGARPRAKVQKPEKPPKPTKPSKTELKQKVQEEAGQMTLDIFGKAG